MIKLKDILNESDVFANTSNTSMANGAEAEIEDAFDDLEKDIQKLDLDAPETEAIGLTLAGVALSFGEISRLLGKFVNLISKIP